MSSRALLASPEDAEQCRVVAVVDVCAPSSSSPPASTASPGVPAEPSRVVARRWCMLAILCLLIASNGALWITFAPITAGVSKYYDVGEGWINALSISYMIVYLPLAPLSGWIIEALGLRTSSNVGAWLDTIGAWIRFASVFAPAGGRFAVLAVGHVISAFAQPFLLNAPTTLAALWFPPSQRAVATTICTASNPIGIAIAMGVVPALYSGSGRPLAVLLFMAVFASVPGVLAVFFMSARPPSPSDGSVPSASREPLAQSLRSFLRGTRKVVCNVAFMILVLTWGMGLGVFNAVTTLIEQLTKPADYSSDQAGYFGVAVIIAGLLGAGVVGVVVDRTHRYREILWGTYVATLAGCVAVTACNRHGLFWPLLVSFALFGFGALSTIAVVFEGAVEATYPVAESTSAFLLWSSGQLFGVVFVVILAPVGRKMGDMRHTMYIVDGAVAAMVVISFFFRTDYKRLQQEARTGAQEDHRPAAPADEGQQAPGMHYRAAPQCSSPALAEGSQPQHSSLTV
eukprot:m51a1_g10628 hypothetical protein (514) ;mRNA; f:36421-38645